MHKVKEHMDRMNQNECSRPMLIYIMVEILSTMSAKAKWVLMTWMKKLSLQDFDGKDIDALSTITLGVFKRLKILILATKDMPQIMAPHLQQYSELYYLLGANKPSHQNSTPSFETSLWW